MKKIPLLALGALIPSVYADQQILDDLIVRGSIAVGQDAVNGESFGFDTIRLKENNLRIKFQDTSNSASFPTTDWQLTANDSGNGGLNKFSIDDIDSGRTPFTIEGSAPSHSLYVDDGGRVGLGTAAPVVELHVVDGDSPTMRLEQDGSSGFTPQTWDVAGNETNFFVRDATNGSRLPFKIRPSAPNNSLYVDTDGDIGLGTASPSARLDVVGSAEINGSATITGADGTAQLLVDETSTTAGARTLLDLRNNGAAGIAIQNTAAAATWDATVDGVGSLVLEKSGSSSAYTFTGDGALVITNPGGFGSQTIFNLDAAGNITTSGTVNGSSDANRKENFKDVDPDEILEKVAAVPIKYWTYKGEEIVHMGPMAQDFYASFQLGQGDRTIAMPDADGVAIASIQALYKESKAKDVEISQLREANTLLEERLQRIEKLMGQ